MNSKEGIHYQHDSDLASPLNKITSSETFELENYLLRKNNSLKRSIVQIEPLGFLDLMGKDLNDKDMATILKYGVYEKQCQYLYLARNHFTHRSMRLVSHALRETKNLKDLDLSFNPIGNEGAKILTEALSSENCFLRELDLTCTSIGDEGARYLAKILPQNLRLERLILNKNDISKVGLEALVEPLIDPQTQLKVLKLEGNYRLTQEEIYSFLVQIDAHRCNVREIHFRGCFTRSTNRPVTVFTCCNDCVRVIF